MVKSLLSVDKCPESITCTTKCINKSKSIARREELYFRVPSVPAQLLTRSLINRKKRMKCSGC